MTASTTPYAAVLAREVLVDARRAVISTGTSRSGAVRSVVDLHDGADGLPRLLLDAPSAAVPGLAACRVASLTVQDPGSARRLRIVASFRMRRPDATGRRGYDPTILSIRLEDESGAVTVPVDEFLRSAPDRGRVRRRALVEHLQDEHGHDLLEAVRAHGAPAAIVVVDTDGPAEVILHALGDLGAERLTLAYDAEPGDLALADVCACGAIR